MDSSTLTQQGIDAYKAGNKEEAVRLLSDAVRADRQNEEAWLYLGAALEDQTRKRQAFQRVLEINPNNERAKNALARLSAAGPAASTGPTPGSTAGATASRMGADASARMNAAGAAFNKAWKGDQGFKVPGNIPGAPAMVTIPEMIDAARTRITQTFNIYKNQDYEQVVAAGQTATLWDAVFIALVGVVAVGLAELLGGLIGWPLSAFHNGIFGLITPFFAAIAGMAATAAGFAAAVYGSRYYLQNQNINVPLAQHAMYYALIFLPITLVNAAFTFLSHALGFLILCLAPIVLIVGIALAIYGWFVLKGAFDRVYGSENNRGLITAAVAIIGGWIGSGIVRWIFAAILRV